MSLELSIDDLEALLDAGWEVPERDRWKPRQLNAEEFREEYQFLRSAGCGHDDIARRFRVTVASLRKRLAIAGLDDGIHGRLDALLATGRTFMADDLCDNPAEAANYIVAAVKQGRAVKVGKVRGATTWRGVTRG